MEISSNAKTIKDCKKLALLLDIGQDLVRRGKDEDLDPDEIALDILTDWAKANSGKAARKHLYETLDQLNSFKEVAGLLKKLLLGEGQPHCS